MITHNQGLVRATADAVKNPSQKRNAPKGDATLRVESDGLGPPLELAHEIFWASSNGGPILAWPAY